MDFGAGATGTGHGAYTHRGLRPTANRIDRETNKDMMFYSFDGVVYGSVLVADRILLPHLPSRTASPVALSHRQMLTFWQYSVAQYDVILC